MIDTSKVIVLDVDEIHMDDYPDFCDAYISAAEIDGRELDEDELEELNDNRDYRMQDQIMNFIIQRNT